MEKIIQIGDYNARSYELKGTNDSKKYAWISEQTGLSENTIRDIFEGYKGRFTIWEALRFAVITASDYDESKKIFKELEYNPDGDTFKFVRDDLREMYKLQTFCNNPLVRAKKINLIITYKKELYECS